MISAAETHKPQPKAGVVYEKTIELLKKHARRNRKGIISFPDANRILSWLFHLNKQETAALIDELKEKELITVYPYHGIALRDNTRISGEMHRVIV